MKKISYFLLTLFFLINEITCKIRFVVDVMRHGAHTAKDNLPFFPDIIWIYKDELTAVGGRQAYLLGRLRRLQYIETNNFLPTSYDPTKIYVHSTETRRSLMTTQSYLLGLYPNGLPKLNDVQLRQVRDLLAPPIPLTVSDNIINTLNDTVVPFEIPIIPIQAIDPSVENLLRVRNCPRFDKSIDQYYASEIYKKTRTEKFGKLWDALKTWYPQITEEYLSKDDNARTLVDFLICTDLEGKRPSKITPDIMQQIYDFWRIIQRDGISIDPMLVKLALNVFAKDITDKMNGVIEGKNNLLYALYGGHSNTVNAIIMGLKTFNQTIDLTGDLFSANVLFELNVQDGYEKDENAHYITVYHNGNVIHNESYPAFRANLLKVGDLGMSREDACKPLGTDNGKPIKVFED